MKITDIKKDIKKIIDVIKETDVTEIEISDSETRIKICRQPQGCGTLESYTQTVHTVPAPPPNTVALAPTTESVKIEKPEGKPINAPMVGTIYLTPSPDAEPFVKIGQRISAGDPICLIEAMKMFNKVESDISGVVSQCLVEHGQPVEFNQPLFLINTDA